MTANADRTDPGPVRAGLNFNDCSDIPISSAHSTDASIVPAPAGPLRAIVGGRGDP